MNLCLKEIMRIFYVNAYYDVIGYAIAVQHFLYRALSIVCNCTPLSSQLSKSGTCSFFSYSDILSASFWWQLYKIVIQNIA